MDWIGRWARRSQERALTNAREASTDLSRRRVERDEVELYCRRRYAGAVRPAGVGLADERAAAGDR